MAMRAVEPRLEPHSISGEQAVLGSCLIDRDAITRLAPYLDAGDFYRAGHADIWRAMTGLFHRRIPIDILTIVEELRRADRLDITGGEVYLAELIEATPTAVHAEYYAGIVREAAIRRRLIQSGSEIVGVAWDETLPISDVIARADEALTDASRIRSRDGYQALEGVMQTIYENIGSETARVVPTGVGPLDEIIGGFVPGQLVVPAARPGFGKSSLGGQIADHQARVGIPVGIISLEMTGLEIGERMVALNSGVNMHRVRTGMEMDEQQKSAVTRAFGMLSERPLYIDDHSNGSLHDVLARARTMYAERGIQMLIVDYLQLMHVEGAGRGMNRTQEVAQMTAALKSLARELNIIVLCLSQLSRASERRNPPVPMLSDLRDSGGIEQDADIVIFLHREDAYSDDVPKGQTLIIVAKHRNGPVGMRRALFVPHTSQFVSEWGEM